MKLVFKKYGIDFINGQRQQLQENAFEPGDTQLVKRHTLTLVKHIVCRSLSETSYLDILNCPYWGTRRGVTAPRHPGGVCSVYLLNSGKESSYLSNHMFRTTVLSHHTQFPRFTYCNSKVRDFTSKRGSLAGLNHNSFSNFITYYCFHTIFNLQPSTCKFYKNSSLFVFLLDVLYRCFVKDMKKN